MMQNIWRRHEVSRSSGHTALAARPAAAFTHLVVADVLNNFELWTVLECHAVSRAASVPGRDMHAVRAVFPELNPQVLAPADPIQWQRLELRLHRAIADQAGNPLLADMVELICRKLQTLWTQHISPLSRRPGTLWLLQCQHRKILSCIEAGEVEEATVQTRAHLHLMRDQLLAALQLIPRGSPSHSKFQDKISVAAPTIEVGRSAANLSTVDHYLSEERNRDCSASLSREGSAYPYTLDRHTAPQSATAPV